MTKRVVFDTNVLVSALLFEHSVPAQAVFRALSTAVVVTSVALVQELQAVLQRKKFDRYLTMEERDAFVTTFALTAQVVTIADTVQVCRDPKDDKVLDAAINGQADSIVTGDPDLLILHPFRNISILTPSAFLQTLS